MECERCREELSARLDGEDAPAGRAAVDAHLSACAECRGWYDDAAVVTRLARTAPVPPARGVSDAVLDAAPGPWRTRVAAGLRWALGGLGLAQFLLGVAQVVSLAGEASAHAGRVASAGHLWHESAAWNVAVGAGFAWIAVRRGRPSGVTPMLTVFVAVLALLSLGDAVSGRVAVPWLLSHGFILAGYAIILLLGRPAFDFGAPPSGRGAGRWSLWLDPAEDGERSRGAADRQRDHGAPAARQPHREAPAARSDRQAPAARQPHREAPAARRRDAA